LDGGVTTLALGFNVVVCVHDEDIITTITTTTVAGPGTWPPCAGMDQCVDVVVQWSQSEANRAEALWEVMEDFASSSAATGAGNGTVCVLPGSTYTLIAVDPLEQGEWAGAFTHRCWLG